MLVDDPPYDHVSDNIAKTLGQGIRFTVYKHDYV